MRSKPENTIWGRNPCGWGTSLPPTAGDPPLPCPWPRPAHTGPFSNSLMGTH